MNNPVIATNRKAFHEYNILEKFEAGIKLKGSEVKSAREGKASLKQSYVLIIKTLGFFAPLLLHQNIYNTYRSNVERVKSKSNKYISYSVYIYSLGLLSTVNIFSTSKYS